MPAPTTPDRPEGAAEANKRSKNRGGNTSKSLWLPVALSRFARSESRPFDAGHLMLRRSLVLFAVFCMVAALVPAAAQAHEPAPTRESYEVEVDKTRDVDVCNFVPKRVGVNKTRQVPVYGYVTEDVYNFVPKRVGVNKTRQVPVYGYVTGRVRVAPFTETYTYKRPCQTVIISGQAGTYCPPSETRTRAAYNYKRVTKKIGPARFCGIRGYWHWLGVMSSTD